MTEDITIEEYQSWAEIQIRENFICESDIVDIFHRDEEVIILKIKDKRELLFTKCTDCFVLSYLCSDDKIWNFDSTEFCEKALGLISKTTTDVYNSFIDNRCIMILRMDEDSILFQYVDLDDFKKSIVLISLNNYNRQ